MAISYLLFTIYHLLSNQKTHKKMFQQPSPDALLEEIRKDMSAVMDTLENGGFTDLAEIDAKVRNFCDVVTAMPGIQAKKYQEILAGFITELTKITNKLVEQKTSVQVEIDSLSYRQKAQNAYGASALRNNNNNQG